jgi:hypothetical protein
VAIMSSLSRLPTVGYSRMPRALEEQEVAQMKYDASHMVRRPKCVTVQRIQGAFETVLTGGNEV